LPPFKNFYKIVKNIILRDLKMQEYYVYILTRERNSVFYVGVTNDLIRRVYEHKNEMVVGFSKKYQTKMLVYYEQFDDIGVAISKEKIIKKWKRRYKISAIERMNPEWKDLYFELMDLD
jgi:putative endonuclease